jgi:hypothetical protein
MTGLSGPPATVTKTEWTLFEEVKVKNGKCEQCRLDFVSKKSIVRNV